MVRKPIQEVVSAIAAMIGSSSRGAVQDHPDGDICVHVKYGSPYQTMSLDLKRCVAIPVPRTCSSQHTPTVPQRHAFAPVRRQHPRCGRRGLCCDGPRPGLCRARAIPFLCLLQFAAHCDRSSTRINLCASGGANGRRHSSGHGCFQPQPICGGTFAHRGRLAAHIFQEQGLEARGELEQRCGTCLALCRETALQLGIYTLQLAGCAGDVYWKDASCKLHRHVIPVRSFGHF